MRKKMRINSLTKDKTFEKGFDKVLKLIYKYNKINDNKFCNN